jgi:hypothetical protein
MKSGGFPCRYQNCEERFSVSDPSSMSSLLAASEARTDHEVKVHGYHHQRLDIHVRTASFTANAVSRRTPRNG